MERGHTKFAPDAMFGVLKRTVFRNNVETFSDLKSLTSTCANCLRAIDSREIVWRDWAAFLKQFYGKFIGVTKYHRFQFLDGHAGIVASLYDSDPTFERSIILTGMTDAVVQSPDGAGLKGISEFIRAPLRMAAERKRFLIERVAPHVSEAKRATFIAELDFSSAEERGAEAVEDDEDGETSDSDSGSDGNMSESESEQRPKRKRLPRGRGRGWGRGRGGEAGRRGRPRRYNLN
jgi:hypothetical protein